MAQDEVILDGDLSLDIPLDGDAQLDLQLDGAVGLLTLIEAGIAQIIFNDDYTITFILTDGREFTTGSIRGAVGEKGDKGDKGDTGERGEKGEQGERGLQGETGAQGIQGERGEQGLQGIQGVKGDTGEKGDKGDAFTYSDFTPEQLASLKGEKGDKGDQGIQGEKGDKGDTGAQGIQGEKGDTGPQGPKGDKGDTGETGPKGDQGDDYILTQQDKDDIAGLVDVPVDDVQVNGTSIVQDGVANVPVASSNNLGVVKLATPGNYDSGIAINNEGQLYVSQATDAQVKNGVQVYKPIVPYKQHISTFYGLAKVAGHDENGSTLPLGEYTEEAKIAIQKMLGIYEAPWELIREETFTNETEANYKITVDANGEPFELTDIAFMLWLVPTTTDASIGSSGTVKFYFNSGSIAAYFGEKTVTVGKNPQGASALIMQKDGLLFRQYTRLTTFGTDNNVIYTGNQVQTGNGWLQLRKLTFNEIEINSITGSAGYRLFGKRKWQ